MKNWIVLLSLAALTGCYAYPAPGPQYPGPFTGYADPYPDYYAGGVVIGAYNQPYYPYRGGYHRSYNYGYWHNAGGPSAGAFHGPANAGGSFHGGGGYHP